MRAFLRLSSALLVGVLVAAAASAQQSFIAFESGPVRLLAKSPDGTRLFAVNTPGATLEIFRIGAGGIAKEASVPVGLEPVSVAARSNGEVWVVNHLSDSVSIVDVAATPPRVVRTLLVGDEPRDIVFAGTGGNRAFITTAHRGQHRVDASIAGVPGAGDPQLTTAGVNRADVWVFDATNLGTTFGGTPQRIVTLFGDTPRALAVSSNGNTVYAAVFHSGNQTTTVSEGTVCDDGNKGDNVVAGSCVVDGATMPGGLPLPTRNFANVTVPEVGLVVKWAAGAAVCNPPVGAACSCNKTPATSCTLDSQCPVGELCGKWQDELGRNWNGAVRFFLPDKDVFAIDANTLTETASFTGVGTILFNMAVNPVSGKVYVSNIESPNEVRFEGPGTFAAGFKPVGEPSTVQGHLSESRITVLSGATVTPRHLNKHIDYSQLPAPSGTKNHSLATPVDMVVNAAGTTLYVAAFGSSKVGVFSTSALENDTFNPTADSANYISVSGGGPGGLVLDEARGRLYVLTRFDNSVSVVDVGTKLETQHVALHNPEPAAVVQGRPFLYDAFATSSNGEASCSSCHIFGDMDDLAWDLGDPDDAVKASPIPINLLALAQLGGFDLNGGASNSQFHPMKGPMTTQTLRGLSNSGAMHWRGDRANGFFGIDGNISTYGNGNEDLSFRNFIVAFPGLVGRDSLISSSEMQAFTDFALKLTLPPNPVRNLDNSLTAAQSAGRDVYLGINPARRIDGLGPLADSQIGVTAGFTCEGCHRLDASQGFFGTGALASFENEPQTVKIPHLRNMYQKVGMFGMPNVPFNNAIGGTHQGNQVRGFGFLHDGSTDTLFRFFNATVFNNANQSGAGTVGFSTGSTGDTQRRNVEQFTLAFDSDLAPIVGQQITLTSTNSAAVTPRLNTLVARAATPFTSKVLGAGVNECDLIAKGTVGGVKKGWLRTAAGTFQPDDGGPNISRAVLESNATTAGQELTFTCVPPGSGTRMGINRDLDNFLDGLDNCPAAANNSQADVDTDLVGDACDNCVAKSNGPQTDTDADGTGDLCDNLCVGPATVLSAIAPASGPVNTYVQITGTGLGPNYEVRFNGVAATEKFESLGILNVRVPASIPVSTVALVEIVNPEGCRSQEVHNFTVTAPSSGCGLLGIEPLGLLALRRVLRRRRSAAPA